MNVKTLIFSGISLVLVSEIALAKTTDYTVEPGLNTVWVDHLDISKWNQTIEKSNNAKTAPSAEMDALTDKNPALERTVCETRIPLPPKPKDAAKSVKSTRIAAGEKATGYTVEPGLNTVWVDNLDISKWNQTIEKSNNTKRVPPVEMDALTDKNPALERTVCETRIPLPPKPKDVAKSVKSTRIAAGEKATGYTVEPGLNTVWVDNLDISKWNQTIDNADNKQDESPVRRIATQEVDYMLVTDETTPYNMESRKDYSLKLRGCVATLIHKNWAMTAAHCIPRRKVRHPNKIKVGYLNESGKYSYVRAKKVFKKKKADIALIQLKSSIERVEPVLMLDDRLKPQDKMIKIKKVSRKKSWSNIPAKASKKKKMNLFVPKRFRKGKAGTSGSPWVYHSTAGDVVVAVTHGGGRGKQVGFVSNWIKKTVASASKGDTLYFIHKKDMLNKY